MQKKSEQSEDTLNGDAPAFTLNVAQLAAIVAEAVAAALAEAHPVAAPILLDRNGLAKALGCSASQVDKLRKAGMPWVRLGDCPRFELALCLAWVREQR